LRHRGGGRLHGRGSFAATNVEAGIDVESGETIDVVITIGQQ
jgi:hypothetical protein